MNVRAGIDQVPFPARLLRAHVLYRSRIGRSLAEVLFLQGEPEVRHVGFPFGIEQDVGRLYVAVNETALMRVMEGLSHTSDHFHCRCERQPALKQPLPEIAALDEL